MLLIIGFNVDPYPDLKLSLKPGFRSKLCHNIESRIFTFPLTLFQIHFPKLDNISGSKEHLDTWA